MVAGHLREKSGYYYAVLNYTDSLGKRKTKWISTGLTVKGNKKRAEAILMDARRNFNPEEPKVMNGDILFADYMEQWLDIIKSSVAVPTYASYSTTVKKIVAPYFRKKEVTLEESDGEGHSGVLLEGTPARQCFLGHPLSCQHSQGTQICRED